MKAIQITRHGAPEVRRPIELPDPIPAPSPVLVRNAWLGVNVVDLQLRPASPCLVDLPLIPGMAAAGPVAVSMASTRR